MSNSRLTYAEKLRDPRWQRLRLKIMERDGFACRRCGDTESTLHVHHGYYERGLEPWEYDQRTLHTLCENCHEQVGEILNGLHRLIAAIEPEAGAYECVIDAATHTLVTRG